MKISVELRNAARRIKAGKSRAVCDAIQDLCTQNYFDKLFLFKHTIDRREGYWMTLKDEPWISKETQQRRLLALLLAADIAESEGL